MSVPKDDKPRPWHVVAEEITKQPINTPAEEERFQELTNELLLSLRGATARDVG